MGKPSISLLAWALRILCLFGCVGGEIGRSQEESRPQSTSDSSNGEAEAANGEAVSTGMEGITSERVTELKRVMEEPNPFRLNSDLIRLIPTLSEADMPFIAAMIREKWIVGGREQLYDALRMIFTRWAEIDPVTAMGQANRLRGIRLFREFACLSVMSSWITRDPDGAIAYLDSLPTSAENQFLRQGTLNAFASVDATRAIELAGRDDNPIRKVRNLEAVLHVWAELDREAAMRWVMGTEEKKLRTRLLPVALGRWIRHEPQKAMEFMKALEVGEIDAAGERAIFRTWVQNDPDGAFAFAFSLPPDEHLKIVKSDLAYHVSLRTREEIVALIETIPSDDARNEFVSLIAVQLADVIPRFALEICATLPEGAEREKAVANVASKWAGVDFEGVSEWLRQTPEIPNRDLALLFAADAVLESDPVAGLKLMEEIESLEFRHSWGHQFYAKWRNRDRASAEAWMASDALLAKDLRAK